MYRGQRIYLVIPCYNVAPQLPALLASVPDSVDGIVAVDDGSRDDTAAVLAACADPRLVTVRHERNRGVGAAMRTGFQRAAELGGDLLVKVDGDGQMDLRDLPALLDPLTADDRYGYAKGNRLVHVAGLKDMPRNRRVGNFALTFLMKLASGYWHVVDPQNGFIAIRRSVWELLDPARISDGYFFENDMLINLNILDVRVKDVPLPARYGSERSNLRIHRVLPAFTGLLLRRLWYRFYTKYILRDFSPIALFGLVGSVLLVWAIGFGGWNWYDHAQRGIVTPTGTVMLAVLPLLIGFELVLQALVLDIQNSPR